MENTIRSYFSAWLKKDVEPLEDIFAENAVYSECYGPEYHGLSQIISWFSDWNEKGQVLEWSIKRLLPCGSSLVVEWHFVCSYENNTDAFDGVSVVDFDENMKIARLCEFQSKAEHYYPYEKQ